MKVTNNRASLAVLLLVIVAIAGSLRLCTAAEQLAKPTTTGNKQDGTGAVVVETVKLSQAGLDSKEPRRRETSTTEPKNVPTKTVQQGSLQSLLAGTTGSAGSAEGGSGRKLLGLGDSCSVVIRNNCGSRQTFQVSWGGYSNNWYGFGYGWRATGWFNVPYGRSITLSGTQTMYVAFTRGIRLSTRAASFCVSTRPYDILNADDDPYYYRRDLSNGKTYYSTTCSGLAGGYWATFYTFPTCGMSINVKNSC